MLLLLVLTLLAYEAKGLEEQIDSHAKLQNFPSKAGETLFHHPYSRLVHPDQNQKPQHEVLGEIAETQCSTGVIRIEQGQEGKFSWWDSVVQSGNCKRMSHWMHCPSQLCLIQK
ncbi:hypothetical protein OIU85_015898 [Salix viminalis]|uniref:Uncharacterized protein n=1 Tax=Salix viminalis TaxID=40686 RepID=A0A9Q0ZP89_SALVM|nr:hypothetical protein OIU85_015898 [Salix viminalis]